MPTSIPSIDSLAAPENLARAEVLARSNQGIVYRLAVDDREVAVKEAAGAGPLLAVNRHALKREFLAYQRLAGVPGVPRCLGMARGRLLVLEYIPGTPFRGTTVGTAFFDRLLTLVQTLHARGVAHGDLKRKANLMVDSQGRPVLLDFGAATLLRQGRHPINRRLFEFMRQTDLNAWVKLKYGGYSGVSEDDRKLLRRSWLERLLSRYRG